MRGRGAAHGGRGWGPMPTAPGTQLDSDVRDAVLASGNAHRASQVQRPQVAQAHHSQQQQTYRESVSAIAPSAATSGTGNCIKQPYDCYVVLDFEATCEENRRIPNQEVIEFPFVVVDADSGQIIAEFQRYVRPVVHPVLSDYCTNLTGITQDVVDQAEPFPEVFAQVKKFMQEELGLGDSPPSRSYCIVTCGDWDLDKMLPAQLHISGALGVPESFYHWCNLKTFMKAVEPPFMVKGRRARLGGMPDMLEAVNLPLVGRHHSGIDDCRNIARVLMAVMARGHVVGPTKALKRPLQSLEPWRSSAALPTWEGVKHDLSPFAPPPSTAPAEKNPSPTAASGEPAGTSRRRKKEGQSVVPAPRLPALVVDSSRDAAADALANAGGRALLPVHQRKTVSKALSFILRHGADEERVPITTNGYCLLTDLLNVRSLKNRKTTAADVAEVVLENEKQRFRMVYEATGAGPGAPPGRVFVAATQGHSLEGVEVDMKTIQDRTDLPEVVIHGTYWDALRKIRECGYLSSMSRHHIHFAKGFPKESGVISGMRATVQVVLYLDVDKCLADGVPLLESRNGVVLTAGVDGSGQLPLAYIKKAMDIKSGEPIRLS